MKIGRLETDLVDVIVSVGALLVIAGGWAVHPGMGLALIGIIMVIVVVWTVVQSRGT